MSNLVTATVLYTHFHVNFWSDSDQCYIMYVCTCFFMYVFVLEPGNFNFIWNTEDNQRFLIFIVYFMLDVASLNVGSISFHVLQCQLPVISIPYLLYHNIHLVICTVFFVRSACLSFTLSFCFISCLSLMS